MYTVVHHGTGECFGLFSSRAVAERIAKALCEVEKNAFSAELVTGLLTRIHPIKQEAIEPYI